MPRIQLLAAVVLALVLALAIACGGDDDGDNGTPGDGATTTSAPSNGEAPSDGADDDGQPSTGDATATPSGTPATFIDDIVGWLEENYPNVSPPREDCTYNPGTLIATCPGHGDFAVDPPLSGQDITCQSLLVNGIPVAITCTSQVPLQAIYYEIQR